MRQRLAAAQTNSQELEHTLEAVRTEKAAADGALAARAETLAARDLRLAELVT